MIGWKIVCNFEEEEEVVCEVVGQAVVSEMGYGIPVYHKGHIRVGWFSHNELVKVIERK